ncbi:hypothetical protein GCM10011374_33180 [Kocuria dechangensis]|uniref:Uncharacterized protein n=1 Tax=Kocuria dechangensis TaxID=1176249 RepID=A0A917H453_9MICC|nr:hypothetical protein [Kocuria dechangensis]GGG66438.1 hypothetical protein GCM10011374_33180 [Kocuria dechangensis]
MTEQNQPDGSVGGSEARDAYRQGLYWYSRTDWRPGAAEDGDLEPFVLHTRRRQMGAPVDPATPGQSQPVQRTYRVRHMPEGYSGYLEEADVTASADPHDELLYVKLDAVLHHRPQQDKNRGRTGYKLTRLENGGTEYRYELREAEAGVSVVYPCGKHGDDLIEQDHLAVLPAEMAEPETGPNTTAGKGPEAE